jgi:hypothetical protein
MKKSYPKRLWRATFWYALLARFSVGGCERIRNIQKGFVHRHFYGR